MNHTIKSILTCIALLLAGSATSAEEALKNNYGVVSLVGDKIEVVTRRMATGSNVDRNGRQSIPMPGGVFDDAALLAVQASIKQLDAGARTTVYGLSAADMFENQERFFNNERAQLPDPVLAALRNDNVTRLLLITKHRAPASLRVGTESMGTGYLEGLGFYVDHSTPMIRPSTGETAKGMLLPFLYVKVSLIDVASLTVLRSVPIKANHVSAPIGVDRSADAWNALTPAEKVQSLKDLIEDQVPKTVRIILRDQT